MEQVFNEAADLVWAATRPVVPPLIKTADAGRALEAQAARAAAACFPQDPLGRLRSVTDARMPRESGRSHWPVICLRCGVGTARTLGSYFSLLQAQHTKGLRKGRRVSVEKDCVPPGGAPKAFSM